MPLAWTVGCTISGAELYWANTAILGYKFPYTTYRVFWCQKKLAALGEYLVYSEAFGIANSKRLAMYDKG